MARRGRVILGCAVALGLPNITITFNSPWRGIRHNWSHVSFHSGQAFTAQSDQISYLQSVFLILSMYIVSGDTSTFVSKVKYYDGVARTPVYEAVYTTAAAASAAGFRLNSSGTNPNQGQAYGGSGETIAPFEACCILAAPVGLSKTGKPVLLKHYMHQCAGAASSTADNVPYAVGGAAECVALGNGSLFGGRVLASSSGKQGTWNAEPYYGNHQAYRRRKKKTTLSSSQSSDLLEQILTELGSSALGAAASTLIP